MDDGTSVENTADPVTVMSKHLNINIGQHSSRGRKEINQDFHGALVPTGQQLSSKGVALALADGISSSEVSQVASEAAVTGFLEDYYCTSESWSVKTSARRVLMATNSWLCSQTLNSPHRFNKDRGYVCTFSALIFKSTTAHLFHAGDSRIYRLIDNSLEQLTQDHRIRVTGGKSYLGRALGVKDNIEIDYHSHLIDKDDVYILATDGVYEYIDTKTIVETIHQHRNDLNKAASVIVKAACKNGSNDNLTIQIARVEELPDINAKELYQQSTELPFPPELLPRMQFDGYEIIREIYFSSRSHVYLAVDNETKQRVVIKTPSVSLRGNAAYLERFLLEEWIARRINNAHVLKPCNWTRQRNYIYITTEYIEGQTLKQWMIDNPEPAIETVRDIIEQISSGLRAFHRQEMLHQDLRPDNIMIDLSGTVKIIDFGSTRVAGLVETITGFGQDNILGTMLYTAPEYFLGEKVSTRSDLFSLGVIAYHMLTGKLPYGTKVAKARTRAAQRKLNYLSALNHHRTVPVWVDMAIKKAVHPNPLNRYTKLSEFVHDLRYPNHAFLNKTQPPFVERSPLLFWKGLSLVLFIFVIVISIANYPGAL